MRAKNFRLLLPALVLACTATFALADDGQAAQHVAGGMPVVSDHADHAGIMPGTLVARNDNGRHEGWHKDKPRPRSITRRDRLPAPVRATIVPVTAPVPARGITVPVTARARVPASMTVAALAPMGPAPARVPTARGPITGLMVPVPARTPFPL